ncbi:MAG: CmcI family methyltransferase [Candidatus Omnitrophica bacterium]|nr:CmcI family methyltransferase [Candidatus Omnitrophota bacterium]
MYNGIKASDPVAEFQKERKQAIEEMAQDEALRKKSLDWMLHADKYKYSYNFTWMGRPIIKLPQDIIAIQELIWSTKPDLIIETGIAHGGSIIFSASMLELVGKGEVFAVDIDIRKHNRILIEAHPMFKRITMIEGSSVEKAIFNKISIAAKGKKKVMVILDSLHTHDHVLKELRLYSKLVTIGCHLILPDTFIEFFPKGYFSNRPWDVGSNTMTALKEFLRDNKEFVIDHSVNDKLVISEGIDGYLKRIR